MNKKDRKELARARDLIGQALTIIETLAGEEREKFENQSEGLQQSEAGQKLEANADALDEIVSGIQGLDEEIEGLLQ